ncbi:MAG: GHKL domain-containing protein [Cytophagaceae bacterium]|jgi:signal transduction histidine kinase|nr:GHKL domain-containing protein [Cytophagaceae bacterium]
MKNRCIHLIVLLAAATTLLLAAVFLRRMFPVQPEQPFSAAKIERTVQGVQKQMNTLLDEFTAKQFESHEQLWKSLDSLNINNIDLLVYQGVEPVAWTNQLLPVEGFNPNYFRQSIVRLDNGWYLTALRQKGQIVTVAFSLLKHEYPYQNNLLQDGFAPMYNLAPATRIQLAYSDAACAVRNEQGATLFYLLPESVQKNFSKTYIAGSWLLCAMTIVLLVFFFRLQRAVSDKRWSNRVLFLSIPAFAVVYYVVFWTAGLSFIHTSELFSPVYFALSEQLPSLGMFLFMSLWMFIVSIWFYRFFKLPRFMAGKTVWLVLMLILTSLFLVFINKLFYILALHSSGSLILTKIVNIDLIAMAKIVIVAFLLLSFAVIYERIVISYLVFLPKHYPAIAIAVITLALMAAFGGAGVGNSDWSFPFFAALGFILVFSRRNATMEHSYTTFLWFAALFAVYSGMTLMDLSIQREEEGRELLVENLSFQLLHDEDPIAEMYLIDIEKQLAHDASLIRLLVQTELDQEAIRTHLLKYYFYGYWSRYDMQAIPCLPQGNLHIEETGELNNCYAYFGGMLEAYGYLINGSKHFHYIDTQNGKVSYFGVFRFFPNEERETSLFIELHSKPFSEGMGYPELLVSRREQARMKLFNDYSYAKYVNGKLVKCSGDYPYKSVYPPSHSALYAKIFVKERNYSHLVYQPAENTVVVMSRRDMMLGDVFMAFSIFFMFFFLFGGLFMLLSRVDFRRLSFRISIQQRIRTAFVLLMLIMLIIVAAGTVYYSVKQYERKHLELLENKIQSVLLELEYKIGFETPETTIPVDYLNYQLQMISSVFYCDVNIFGIDGKLIGTSRQELFKGGLVGEQMNPQAYFTLAYTDAARFLEEEQIGNLRYISFYVPLLSNDSRLVGFVNIPYFVGNNELKEEISSVIVTVINFYLVFSFLVIAFAVFLSRQITRPLLTLQKKLSQLKLDHQNEKLDYKGNDEIGSLVTEYNRVVDELADSADKLARTERELAWREMAKQIAHEIKNPLTPMKLSIQYLQRAWNDKPAEFDGYLKRVTATLIEQIDNLSSIASEFSRFAQMPKVKSEVVNLAEKVENSVMLFQNSTDMPLIFRNEAGAGVMVNADGEQLLGVFNNLIKNAIQAIPPEREGRIEVTVQQLPHHKVCVTVADNGKGIPEELWKKLFTPNFTTKSGGMGLGLAISRRVVESAGGHIRFETEDGKGSVFYVELPLHFITSE